MSQTQTPSSGVDRLLQRLCDASATIGGVVLVAIASVTVVSVIGRAFFSHPILGDVELVQLGCAVVVASFLPYTQFAAPTSLWISSRPTPVKKRKTPWMALALSSTPS
jgi:hypothetical protein